MSWIDDEAIPILRSMLGDTETPVEYSDTRLQDMLINSAYLIVQGANFSNDYGVTLSTQTISPDPSTDYNFTALACLKARAMICFSEFRTASVKAISIKDGPSSIDARGIADAKKSIADKAQKEFEDAMFAYQAGNYAVGEAIVSPFRTLYNYGAVNRGTLSSE